MLFYPAAAHQRRFPFLKLILSALSLLGIQLILSAESTMPASHCHAAVKWRVLSVENLLRYFSFLVPGLSSFEMSNFEVRRIGAAPAGHRFVFALCLSGWYLL